MEMTKIILTLCTALIAGSGVVYAQLSLASEEFEKPLQKLIFTDKQVFVGATDTLYTIDQNTLMVNASLLISNETFNINSKPLAITYLGAYGEYKLIICSSYRGQCKFLRSNADGSVHSTADPHENIATTYTNGSVIFVRSKFENAGEALWVVSSKSVAGPPALSIRSPTDFTPFINVLPSLDDNGYTSVLPYIGDKAWTVQYVYGFKAQGYVFYVKNNHGKAYIGAVCDNDGRFNTLVEFPLVCTSNGGDNSFIQAATSSEAGTLLNYSMKQQSKGKTLTGSDHFLYAVFGKTASSNSTSICVFSVQSLIDIANEVFAMCHINGNNQDVDVGPPELTVSTLQCAAITAFANNDTLTPCQIIKLTSFSRKQGYSPLYYKLDTVRASVIDLNFRVNAMAVKVVEPFTVAFTTTPNGRINKVIIAENHRRGVYDTEDLSQLMTTRADLLPEIAVGEEVIYALTSKQVFAIPVHKCNSANSCEACSHLGDPYCGWCTLSSRCSIKSECDKAGSSTSGRWLQEYSGSPGSGCITPTVEDSNISLQKLVVNDRLKLKVKFNQVPEIEGDEEYYCCLFGDVEEEELCTLAQKKVEVTLDGSQKTTTMECLSPVVSQIQSKIPTNKDHIVTDLVLKIDDIRFTKIELTFYNCTRHTSCTSCATADSAFSCNWCLKSHKCFESDSTTDLCEGPAVINRILLVGELIGEGHCPRIAPFTESPAILVPADTIPKNFKFKLYSKQADVDGYTCELRWDNNGGFRSYPAEVQEFEDYDILKCDVPNDEKLSYKGEEPTKNVEIKIKLQGLDVYLDNPSNATVELYKCKWMKATCSECVSSINSKYNCGWCQSKSSECQVATQCPAGDSFLESSQGNCPDIEIAKIEPTNGPIEGGTYITIIGENLGKSFDQIRDGLNIIRSEGDVICILNDTCCHDPSKVICKTSTTTIIGSGPVRVDIHGDEGLYAESASDFSFLKPSVHNLSAIKGPLSGGSRITIIGENINIGSSQRVTMKLQNGTSFECILGKSGRSGEIIFITSPVTTAQYVSEIALTVDGFSVGHINSDPTKTEFTFVNDSTVTKLNTYKGIISGGTNVTVEGTSFHIIKQPRMYLEPLVSRHRESRSADEDTRRLELACHVMTEKQMTCALLGIPNSWPKDANNTIQCNYGFILDGIKSTLDLALKNDGITFEIGEDPTFENFGEITAAENLKIKGHNLLLIGPQEIVKPMVSVQMVGESDKGATDKQKSDCVVTTIQDNLLYCDMPELEDAAKIYTVTVYYGSVLKQTVGTIALPPNSQLSTITIIGISVGCGVFVIIVIVIIVVLKCRLSQTDQGMKKLQDKMDNLEMTVAKECKEAFTELQTDMTEMTADIAALHGLPFYEYNHYCMKVLFPPLQSEYDHPVMRKLEIGEDRERVEQGIREFGGLINNKTFLLTFIRTLEQQRKFTVRDRVEIGSLISVALQPRMEYHTDILKTLLAELIERTMDTKKDPKILLRRNESVAEKMLSNWFAFLLQKFLKECAGEPLYLLFRAIKQQVDKGPVDAVTADAKYSLSEDKLLRQIVESRPITLRFCSPDPHAVQDPQTVKVLDCDTISQAIDKILDTLYRNVPNTTKPARDRLTLEWLKPNEERVAMSDDDPAFSKIESDYCKKLVTLQCYKISDNAMVALTPKQPLMDSKSSLPKYDTNSSNGNYHSSATGDSLSRANSTNNILEPSAAVGAKQKVLRYHLVKPSEADVHQEGDRNKMVSEIYLTRLLATKGTLQQFVDDLFETVFSTSHRGSALPLAIKYMFDFLDDQALLHSIGNADVIHHWKSNSLPLRFWVNVIKNPDFVFDIHKSNIVDACLSVVAQIFMDSCSLSEHRLGKESPSSKLLYAKDIPKYRKWVDRYYSDIKSMPAISDHEMAAVLAEESRQHRNEFNNSAAMFELYQYVLNYQTEVSFLVVMALKVGVEW